MDSLRGAALWTLDTDDCCFQAEIVDLNEHGWEFRLFINEHFRFSQRYPAWSEAVAESERWRRDLEGVRTDRRQGRNADVPAAVITSSDLSLSQLDAVSAGAQVPTMAAEPNGTDAED